VILKSQKDVAGAIAILDRGIAVATGQGKTMLEDYKAELTGAATTTT
jgi:hypothetical protein